MRVLQLFNDFGDFLNGLVTGTGDYGSTTFYVYLILLIIAVAFLIVSIVGSLSLVTRAVCGFLGTFLGVFSLILLVHSGFLFN